MKTNIHPNDFTLENFAEADHETRKEVVRFWEHFGQPSQMPFWMIQLREALKSGTFSPLAFEGSEPLKEFCREDILRRSEAKEFKKQQSK